MDQEKDKKMNLETETDRIVDLIQGFRRLPEREQIFQLGVIKGVALSLETINGKRSA